MFDFTNQTVLITGGTRGIGKQVADDLAAMGATLLITGTNPEQIAELNAEAQRNDDKKTFFAVNFLDEKSCDAFTTQLAHYQRIDACVNNAGINRLNPIDEAKTEDWDAVVTVNLTTPFKILRTVGGLMKRNNYGRIVNIASIFGIVSREKRVVYSATKFGVHGLTVGASNDLARYNVLINTVSPGFVMTDLTKKNLNETERADLANQVPIRRLAEPSDISSVIVFLISTKNTYLTGQNIVVDGGFTNV